MHPSIPAALLMLLLAAGWLLGRRRVRPVLGSADTTAVAELNRLQIECLKTTPVSPSAIPAASIARTSAPIGAASPAGAAAGSPPDAGFQAPGAASSLGGGAPGRRLLRLQSWSGASREQRLQALEIARQAGRREALPLLRLGLRDPDLTVMAAAAAAMVRFRGRPTAESLEPPARTAGLGSLRQPGRPAAAARLSELGALSGPRSVSRTR